MMHRDSPLKIVKERPGPEVVRRCAHCGGPMQFDPRDTWWVCLLCARWERARTAS